MGGALNFESDIDREILAFHIRHCEVVIQNYNKAVGESAKEQYFISNIDRIASLGQIVKNAPRKIVMEFVDAFFEPLERHGYTEIARSLVTDAIKIAAKRGDSPKLIRMMALRGRLYFIEGDYGNALSLARKSLKLARTLNDVHEEIRALNEIGLTLEQKRQHRRALKVHRASFEMAKSIQDHHLMGLCIGNEGITHKSLGNYKQAIACHLKALRYSDTANDTRSVGRHYGNLGIALDLNGQTKRSECFFNKAFAVAVKLNDQRHQGIWLYSHCEIFSKMDRIEEAVACAAMAIDAFRDIGAPQYESIVAEFLRHLDSGGKL